MNPSLTVIIKTLNEEQRIARAVKSALEAVKPFQGEVIVADSLSSDKTTDIAKALGATVVQLQRREDRGCGSGPQLGYQYATGDYIYLIDGDMELDSEFLDAAIKTMEKDQRLGGVGGMVNEMDMTNLEYQIRVQREEPHMQTGAVDRLNGGGLFRRKALEDTGYFTNRNLHSFEELELALRLKSKGWTLERLPLVAVRHWGHSDTSITLLLRRLKTKYAWGPGEFLRSAIGKPYYLQAIKEFKVFTATMMWIFAVMCSLVLTPFSLMPLLACLSGLGVAVLVMCLRKGGWRQGIYAVSAWLVFGLGTFLGLLASQHDPRAPIQGRLLSKQVR